MKNFFMTAALDLVIIGVSFFLFKVILSGPLRHKIYEKLMSSFAKFIVYIFIATAAITGGLAYYFYRSRYLSLLNIVAPAVVSILVGFVASTVPTRGAGDKINP